MTQVFINLRCSDGLRSRIKNHAKANNRSLNAEVVHALETAYPAAITTDYVAEAITEQFGPRCTDVAEGCVCCEVWKQYDKLKGFQ
nr:Arc family DNA-binding protein [Aminobacter aminovorans]